MTHSIVRNAFAMTMASVGQKIISFAYFTMVARTIGVEGTGKYFFALSFTTIFVVFVDFGLTNVLVREAARATDRLETYLRTVLFFKVGFGIATYAVMAALVALLGYERETTVLVLLSGVTMLLDSLHLTLYGAMRSLGNLGYEAMSITGSQLLTLLLGSAFLFFRLPLVFLILAFTISSFVNVCFIALVLRRRYRLRLLPAYHADIGKPLLKLALPFAVAAIFARVYSHGDSILLSKMIGPEAVGWYSIPYKITYAFQFVPLAVVAAVYPRFSEYFVKDRERLAHLFFSALRYLLLVVAPVCVGVAILAKDIILFLYGPAYRPSILPLQILIVSLLFSFLSFPIGALLNACNRQKTQTGIVGGVMAANILINLALIPRLGVAGAAIAACAGNVLLTVAGAFFVPRIVSISSGGFFSATLRIAASAGMMGIIVAVAAFRLPLFLCIAIGGISYFFLLFLTRGITREDVRELRSLLRP